MIAWLVVNSFLHSKKFDELAQYFTDAAKSQGVLLRIKENANLLIQCPAKEQWQEQPDFVIFWDKDILLAQYLEQQGIPVYNSSEAIDICDHKGKTHLALEKASLPQPDTILAPMTYGNIGYTSLDYLDEVVARLSLPMVVKECYGSFGQQVYLVEDRESLHRLVKELEGRPFLFQKYLEHSKGRDVRLQVVGDKVVAAMYRYSEHDFRANITNGGKMKRYEPSQEEQELAVAACKAVGADFGGVDLLFDEDGMVVCEVNSNAHFVNIYECTKVNTAECIIKYLKMEVKKK